MKCKVTKAAQGFGIYVWWTHWPINFFIHVLCLYTNIQKRLSEIVERSWETSHSGTQFVVIISASIKQLDDLLW